LNYEILKVTNIHIRTIDQPLAKVSSLLGTLSSKGDMIWPKEKWPPMRFRDGLIVGARGGHGPIKYIIEKYNPGEIIEFKFIKPSGFHGIHRFELKTVKTLENSDLENTKTEITHVIDMKTSGFGTFLWIFFIRPLHNALLEDALDKVENHFLTTKKNTRWNLWVIFLRKGMKPGKQV
jgi:hypothetical protein